MEKTDHDLLIENNIVLNLLAGEFKNHLHRHWEITMIALASGMTGVISLIVSVIVLFCIKRGG